MRRLDSICRRCRSGHSPPEVVADSPRCDVWEPQAHEIGTGCRTRSRARTPPPQAAGHRLTVDDHGSAPSRAKAGRAPNLDARPPRPILSWLTDRRPSTIRRHRSSASDRHAVRWIWDTRPRADGRSLTPCLPRAVRLDGPRSCCPSTGCLRRSAVIPTETGGRSVGGRSAYKGVVSPVSISTTSDPPPVAGHRRPTTSEKKHYEIAQPSWLTDCN